MSLFFRPERAVEAVVKVDQDDDLYTHTGLARRDFLGTTLQRAQELSIDLYRTDPIANRAINIYVSHLAGDGFGLSCDNPEVEAIVEEAFTAPRNRFDRHARGFARDWLLTGELFPTVATDMMGNTTIGIIDALAVDRVERSELNNLILTNIVLKRDARADVRSLPIVQAVGDPMADDAGLLAGDAFAWLFDRMVGTTRGMPFLLPVLDWLDGYSQVLWEVLERHKAMRAYFWDVVVQGGPDQVAQAQELWGDTPPRSGGVRFRSDSIMEVSAVAPQLGSYEDMNAARHFLRHIASGLGVQPHWLGDPEDANRSTAESMDRPVLRQLVDVQADWKHNVTELAQYVVDRKVAAGLLPRIVERFDESGNPTGDMVPARDTVELTFPDITTEDVAANATALAQIAQAAAGLEMVQALDVGSIRKVVRRLIVGLGIPADELPDPDEANHPEDADVLDAALESALESLARRG